MPDAAENVGVYCLDVGQGDCTFVIGPPDVAVLCDCADAGVATKFVRDHKINVLQAVVVTHLDRDHIQGMLPFLKSFRAKGGVIGTVYVDFDRPPEDVLAQKLASSLMRQISEWETAGVLKLGGPERDASPKVIASGSGWRADVVLPTHGHRIKSELAELREPNAYSAAIRVVRAGSSLLVGGDATVPSYESVDAAEIHAQGIRVSHHGGDLRPRVGGLSVKDLYARIGAKHAVISVGTTNRHGHPAGEHVDAIRASGAVVRCTQLTKLCDPSPETFRSAALGTGTSVAYPYRHYRRTGALVSRAEVPCASSVVMMIDAAGTVTVEPTAIGWHKGFVDLLATPRCRP